MRKDVASDLTRSSRAFVKVVWPALAPALGGGQLVPVEDVTNEGFAKTLDTVAGIDAWQVRDERHIFGIASRVQWGRSDRRTWETFTVRIARPRTGNATEYQKRVEQIATPGSLYPRWTCQAYLDEDTDELLIAAVALTSDVIAAVTQGIGWENKAHAGAERFWAVPWGTRGRRPRGYTGGNLVAAGCTSLRVITRQGAIWSSAA